VYVGCNRGAFYFGEYIIRVMKIRFYVILPPPPPVFNWIFFWHSFLKLTFYKCLIQLRNGFSHQLNHNFICCKEQRLSCKWKAPDFPSHILYLLVIQCILLQVVLLTINRKSCGTILQLKACWYVIQTNIYLF
jgi:hypothetical protein